MTLYLVRHASAGSRTAYHGADEARPLDAKGRDQAEKIRAFLVGSPITRVLSSAALRCQQTLGPLALERGLVVEEHPDLAEGAWPNRTVELLRSLVDIDAALCSHGDVIPAVVELLATEGAVLVGARKCAKGSVWTLDTRADNIVRAHYAPM